MQYKQEKQGELTTHRKHSQFYLKQIIGEFDAGDRVSVLVNGQVVFDYVRQYDNCHFNFSVQDKSLTLTTELEKLQREKTELEAKIAELSKNQ